MFFLRYPWIYLYEEMNERNTIINVWVALFQSCTWFFFRFCPIPRPTSTYVLVPTVQQQRYRQSRCDSTEVLGLNVDSCHVNGKLIMVFHRPILVPWYKISNWYKSYRLICNNLFPNLLYVNLKYYAITFFMWKAIHFVHFLSPLIAYSVIY